MENLPPPNHSSIWFEHLEELGEFTGIRIAVLGEDSDDDPVWQYFPHQNYDGIGAFTTFLEQEGAGRIRPRLRKRPRAGRLTTLLALIRHLPRSLKARRRLSWNLPAVDTEVDSSEPGSAVAWHCFSKTETDGLIKAAKTSGASVNSYLCH